MARALLRKPTARRRLLGGFFQFVIVVVLVLGVVTRNVPVVVNAVLGLGVTFLPAVLRRDFDVPLDPRFGLLVTVAVCLHTVGMVRFYQTTWWWDHLTHALSATVVASIGYTVVRAFDVHSEAIHLPGRFLAVFVFLFTVALGVFWEVLEFAARGLADALGTEPVVVQYGVEDTMLDLVFDMVGAVVVAAFDTRRLRGTVAAYVEWFDRRLEGDRVEGDPAEDDARAEDDV